MNPKKSSLRWALLALFFSVCSSVYAQSGATVRIWCDAFDGDDVGDHYIQISGTFLPSSPGADDGYVSAVSPDGGTEKRAQLDNVRVEIGKEYTLDVLLYQMRNDDDQLSITAPPGYKVMIEGEAKTKLYAFGGGPVHFIVVPEREFPGLAGTASKLGIFKIEWSLELGSLRNGASAGQLELLDLGTGSSWAALFTPARLYCSATTGTVTGTSVHRTSNVIDWISLTNMFVQVATLTSESYEIRCYRPTQVSLSGATPTFTGKPFVVYRVARITPDSTDSTAIALQITRELRNITSATAEPSVTHRDFTSIERVGTWPAFTWKKKDWYQDGSTPLVEVTATSSGITGGRSESVAARVPGASTAALSVSRTYTNMTPGEMITGQVVGTSSSMTAGFDFYADSSNHGSFGNVKSITLPGGGWSALEYYNFTSGTLIDSIGMVKRRFSPFLSSPSSVTLDATQGEVTYYEYTPRPFDNAAVPSLVERRVNNVKTASTTYTYDAVGSLGCYQTTQTDYLANGQSVVSISQDYVNQYLTDGGGGTSNPLDLGQPRLRVSPDGVAKLYYRTGVTGDQWATYTITGTTTSTTGATSMFGIYVLDGKSTQEVTYRDTWSRVVRTESYVWKSSDWRLISYTDITNDWAGHVTARASSNGSTYAAVWDGDRKTSETDETGVTTTYTYDAAGRVDTSIRASTTNIAELKTRFTYDAAGNVLTQNVGPDSGERIVTTKSYDDAGRLYVETPPGSYGIITHTYDPTNRTHTATRTGAGATTETTYPDGRLYSKTGTGIVAEYHTYGVESGTDGRTWERVDFGSSSSARWKKSWKDWMGHDIRSESPGFNGASNVVQENFYNTTASQTSTGHVYRSTKPAPTSGVIVTRMDYDYLGNAFRTGNDVNDNGLVLASSDRINETDTTVELISSNYWSKKTTYGYPTPSSGTAIVTGIERRRLTGHPSNRLDETQTTDAEGNVTTVTKDVNTSTKVVTVTTTRTGYSNSATETIENGVSTSTTGHDGVTTTTVYDALRRPWKTVQQRNSATTETLYISGTSLPQYVKEKANTTSPVTVATYHYDSAGRKDYELNADSKRTNYLYNLRDQPIKQWGAATYPVAYAYNSLGEKTTMRTFRNPSQDFTANTWPLSDDGSDASNPDPASWTTGDKTTWTYDAGTGLLATKTDASSHSVTYTYNAALQPYTREWSRTVPSGTYAGQHVKATYGYDSTTGEQTSITYNDGTPSVTTTYTRLGQVDSVADTTGTHDFVYDSGYPWRLYSEAFDTFYGSRVATRLYESGSGAVVGRTKGFKLGSSVGSNSELEQTYGFSASSGRFETLTSGYSSNATTRTFRYGYLANSALLQSLAIDQSGGPGGHPFTITRAFEDYRDVLTSVETMWSTASRSKHAYHSNNLHQRDIIEQSGDIFTGYGGSNNLISQALTYNDRGEVTAAPTILGAAGGSGSALSNRQHEFDYDLIGNRKYACVTGSSSDRKYFTANALNQYGSRDNSASPFSGTQSFTYDNDGNVTDDGQWLYTWDAENRLIAMETKPSLIGAGISSSDARRLEFKYDYLHRRVEKLVRGGWNTGTSLYTTVVSQTRFVYDGWSLIAEYAVGSSLSLVRSYTWGLDIARSLTDAGGVGALLQIHDYAGNKDYVPAYDGNGNVTALFDVASSSGTCVAAYEYSPYGEPLRSDGTYATTNPIRFSTKFTDDETNLVYYGRRYYSPSQGRFLGRDTKQEGGGLNLYGFCRNNGVNLWDRLGEIPPGLSNALGLVSGTLQIAAGTAIIGTLGWSGIGAVGGGLLIASGAATFVASAGNIGSMSQGQEPVLNNSGITGLTTSAIAFATNTPYTASDAKLATWMDIGVGTVASGVTLAPAIVRDLPNLVSIGFNSSANTILQSGGTAGSFLSQTGTTTLQLSSWLSAGTPAVQVGSTTVSLTVAAGVVGDVSNVLSLVDLYSNTGTISINSGTSSLQSRTMSFDQAVASNFDWSNVVSVTVNPQTGQVTIVTNGDLQTDNGSDADDGGGAPSPPPMFDSSQVAR